MDETLKSILAVIGGLSTTAIVLVSVAYWIFRQLGEKFIEAKFASRLETFKHEKQKELEQLKFEINKLFDRSTKFHQKEFDILPTAWAMLEDARAHVGGLIASLQEYPDLSDMDTDKIRNLLSRNEFEAIEIEEIVSSKSPTEALSKKLTLRCYNAARKATQDCIFYIRKNGILMPKEIQTQFSTAIHIIQFALVEWEIQGRWNPHQEMLTARNAFGKELPPIMEKLEAELRARLSNLSKKAVTEKSSD
jgi:hypothetical protein